MATNLIGRLVVFTAVVGLISATPAGLAVPVDYVIDDSQSFLRVVEGVPNDNVFQGFAVMEGSRIATTFALIEREPGSLVVPLGGTLSGDRLGDDIAFIGGNVVAAQANPLGPFPPTSAETGSSGQVDNFGGYGAFATPDNRPIEFAVRDAVADLVGGQALIGSPGTGLLFDLVSGVVDYRLDASIASLFNTPELGFLSIPPLIDPVLNEATDPVTESVEGVLSIPLALAFPFSAFADDDSLFVLEGLIVAIPVLPGDYNNDGVVDAIDYGVWRDNVGAPAGTLPNDIDGGPIGAQQYQTWRANFGATAAGSLSQPALLAPEPATSSIVLGFWVTLVRRVRRLA